MALYKKAKVIWQESIKSKYACGTDVSCITKTYEKSIQRYQCVTGLHPLLPVKSSPSIGTLHYLHVDAEPSD
jgi:uncharacterized protein